MISTIFFLNEEGNLWVFMNGQKNACKLRPETTTRSGILYLFGQGNVNFIRKKTVRESWNARPVATITVDDCKCTCRSRASRFAKFSISWSEYTQNTFYSDNLLPDWSSNEMGNLHLLPKVWLQSVKVMIKTNFIFTVQKYDENSSGCSAYIFFRVIQYIT